MIKRIYKLLKALYEYVVEGTVTIGNDQATIHLDREGNLFLLHNNLVLRSEGYNLLDCDPQFTAQVITYAQHGNHEAVEKLIRAEVKRQTQKMKEPTYESSSR